MGAARKLAEAAVVLALVSAAPASAAVPFKDMGAPGGPLNHLQIGNELACQAQHTGDSTFELYPEDTAPGDCGTLLATGGTLYTPDFTAHGRTFGDTVGPRTPFTPVSQNGVDGTGTPANPFGVVTTVTAGATGLRITESDTYVAGAESYRTDVTVRNTGNTPRDVVLYRAADCYLQGFDQGYGFTEPNGGVGCAASPNNNPPGRIIEWVPITGSSQFTEDTFGNVWRQVKTHGPFPNTCAQCLFQVDNGAGLSWSFTVPPGGAETRSHFTTFSPTGTTIAGGGTGSTPSTPAASTPTPPPTTQPLVPVTPPAPTGPSTAGPTVGPKGNPLGLPAPPKGGCIDKRKFSFRLRRPTGRVTRVDIFINKVPTGTKQAYSIRRLTIAKLPNSGRFVVRIEALDSKGTKLISQRTYTRCKKSKVHGHKVKGGR
jgi:hypothetical protein